jgi:hypothetical protein
MHLASGGRLSSRAGRFSATSRNSRHGHVPGRVWAGHFRRCTVEIWWSCWLAGGCVARWPTALRRRRSRFGSTAWCRGALWKFPVVLRRLPGGARGSVGGLGEHCGAGTDWCVRSDHGEGVATGPSSASVCRFGRTGNFALPASAGLTSSGYSRIVRTSRGGCRGRPRRRSRKAVTSSNQIVRRSVPGFSGTAKSSRGAGRCGCRECRDRRARKLRTAIYYSVVDPGALEGSQPRRQTWT